MLLKHENIGKTLKNVLGKKGMGFVVLGIFAGLLMLMVPSNEHSAENAVSAEKIISSGEYCELLESKAVELIKELPDVRDCKVFITLDRGFRYVYATDQHVREEGSGKETEKTVVLAKEGNGESPLLVEETMPSVAGVAVVCRGASYETQYRIIELMCALFDIKSNRITVQC